MEPPMKSQVVSVQELPPGKSGRAKLDYARFSPPEQPSLSRKVVQ